MESIVKSIYTFVLIAAFATGAMPRPAYASAPQAVSAQAGSKVAPIASPADMGELAALEKLDSADPSLLSQRAGDELVLEGDGNYHRHHRGYGYGYGAGALLLVVVLVVVLLVAR